MKQTLFLLLLIICYSCGNDQSSDADEQANTAAQQTKVQQDSIRQLYQQYIEELEVKMPTKCVAERNKINPADEAPLDTAFFVLREQLKRIVEKRDIFSLLNYIDQNIKVSFGEENGQKAFVQKWGLDTPEKIAVSELWPTLEQLLNLGGAFHDDQLFEAPYLGPCWPTEDPYTQGAITGSGVRMRKAPNLTSPVVTNLSYDIVNYIETTPHKTVVGSREHPWIKVKTAKDQIGFVYGQFYRSPIDYRMVFQKNEAGSWKIVSLVAGD